MIIGVTGYIASGKDTLCEALEKQGFKHLSLSDLLREMLREDNKPVNRQTVSKLGSDLRVEHGDGYLAGKALERIDTGDWLVSSIGRVAEAEELAENDDFTLVFVTADQDIRYERVKARNRSGDAISKETFLAQEEKEARGGGASYREFEALKEHADIIIENNGTLQEFQDRIDAVIASLSSK